MNEMQQAKALAAAIVAMKTSATDQQALAASALPASISLWASYRRRRL